MKNERPFFNKNDLRCLQVTLLSAQSRLETIINDGLEKQDALVQLEAELIFGGSVDWEFMDIAEALSCGTRIVLGERKN